MKRTRLAWFPFYVDDFLGGTVTLSVAECGRYALCLAAQWASAERSAIPADPATLRTICRGEDPGPRVLAKFEAVVVDGEASLRNPRLYKEWIKAKAEFDGRSAGAKRTNERNAERNAERTTERPHNPHITAIALTSIPVETNTNGPDTNSYPVIINSESPEATPASRGESASPIAVAALPWNSKACELVIAAFGGTAPGARITKALRPLVRKNGEAKVLEAFGRYVAETDARYFSPESFATGFGRWSGDRQDAPSAKRRALQATIDGSLRGR